MIETTEKKFSFSLVEGEELCKKAVEDLNATWESMPGDSIYNNSLEFTLPENTELFTYDDEFIFEHKGICWYGTDANNWQDRYLYYTTDLNSLPERYRKVLVYMKKQV